jgi:hypothetical protein
MSDQRVLKDGFADFFESPSRATLRALLENHYGETRNLDFKADWPENSGLAKQCLGMANTDGGCLIVGVKEQADKALEPIGLSAFKDKADVVNGLKNFIPASVLSNIELLDFSYDSAEYAKIQGKKFQVLIVRFDLACTPALSLKAGSGIRKAAIYYRHEGVTEEISHDELRSLISKRIRIDGQTVQRELKHHLGQLKILFDAIPRHVDSVFGSGGYFVQSMARMFQDNNPAYPQEDYEQFVAKVIAKKKELIERETGTWDV